jgi:uroporphyrinogen decarboxylase
MMPRETMTPKERWEAVLIGELPDRVPMDYWATPETSRMLVDHFQMEPRDIAKKLHLDLPYGVGATYVGPPLPANTNVFGIHHKDINYGTGVYAEATNSPLSEFNSIKEIDKNYTWPSPDWWDTSSVAEQVESNRDWPLRVGGSEPMLTFKQLRGEAQAMMDLVLNPDIVHYCLGKLFDLAYEQTRRLFEALPNGAKPTFTYVAEDLGSQKNLMYSPKHIKEYLFPGMKRMIDLAHEAGAAVFHHDDGNITEILPDLVELGIDILNPIQWRADGMDRQWLKDEFGKQLVFHGALDNQQTLPFGTPQDVRDEVVENISILGKNGGFILAPCHNIQPNTSLENILAMYETGFEEGFY